MGHAEIQTTMRYLHHAPRADAATVARVFRIQAAQPASADQADVDAELEIAPAAVGGQDG